MQYNPNQQSSPLLAKLLPFLGMGIFFVVIIIALIFFSYILLLGGLIGLVLFVVAFIKEKFFPTKKNVPARQGKTYDHDKF